MAPCVMPGPGEPNTQQLNHVLEPASKELIILKSGMLHFPSNYVTQIL